jgi:RNA polymerase sigma factor (TIGR02999 family)
VTQDLTDLLNAAHSGDSDAARAAYDIVYEELKRWARRSLRAQQRGETLTPTVLVHEVYVRFSERDGKPLRDRAHFFALAARAMRQILVDHARRRGSVKRGGRALVTDLDDALTLQDADGGRTLELDVALTSLEAKDPELARMVEWRFFAGMSFQQMADVSGRSERSLRRDWDLARVYLQRRLRAIESA